MTALNIYRTAKTSPRGPIGNIEPEQARFWTLRRERMEKRNERH